MWSVDEMKGAQLLSEDMSSAGIIRECTTLRTQEACSEREWKPRLARARVRARNMAVAS